MKDDTKDRANRTLDEVHRTEPDPFTDRQNLEPAPVDSGPEDELAQIDRDTDSLDEGGGFNDGAPDIGAADPDFDDQAAAGRSRSDIQEYARRDTSDAPADDEAPRNHDDNDPWGDGIHDTPLTKRYEDMADRDELARRLEDLVADAYDWLGRAEDDDAQEIYDTLVNVSERLGNPSEETTRTEGIDPPQERDEADA
ncbi:MAG: hypothetical protein WD273_04455 [Trueperaceae bacterium]